jgi:hypothetical protein
VGDLQEKKSSVITDYRSKDRKKIFRVKKKNWSHYIILDSVFQITKKKKTKKKKGSQGMPLSWEK